MIHVNNHIDLLLELLAIPAISRKEKDRSDFLEQYLIQKGVAVTRIFNNLLVGDPKLLDQGPKILLNSHIDTVAPVEGWELDPFKPHLKDNKITGLGSNDAGASVVALIFSYLKMQALLKGKINLLLLISAEEEVSGPYGMSAVLDHLGDLDAVIVGEPTGMQPAVAERGLMVLDGEVKGRAGHAARNEGENAIYKVLKDVDSISRLKFPEQSEWLPGAGAQVTMISAGTSHNVVPDVCRFVVDVRSNDRYGNEKMLELIRSSCDAILEPRSTRLQPSSLDPDHFMMTAIRSCKLIPFGSSTLSDMALIQYPSIKIGPGQSARSHTAGEFILLSEIEEGINTYCLLLKALSKVAKSNF